MRPQAYINCRELAQLHWPQKPMSNLSRASDGHCHPDAKLAEGAACRSARAGREEDTPLAPLEIGVKPDEPPLMDAATPAFA
jgi:hypothetical protein